MSGPLWRRAELVAATGGSARGRFPGIGGVSIDTRSLAPGDLFVALAGERRDGHAFVADALAKGAGAALVSRVPEGLPADAPLVVVPDTLRALWDLGAAGRARFAGPVLAVTGSVGKTSTKEMLRSMLAAQGGARIHAAEKSFNNHWGVPLTLARLPREATAAVLELGMNAPGEIAPLARLAQPAVAVITTVAPVHLAAFDSVEGIAEAKAEIFAGLAPGGTAVLNLDNPHFARLRARAEAREARIVTFGRHPAADFRLVEATVGPARTDVRATVHGEPLAFALGAPGAHFAVNALAALAAVAAAGGALAPAIRALADWQPPEGRGRRWRIRLAPPRTGAVALIDESYNANPESVRAALEVLAAASPGEGEGRGGRRLAFLGDMLELGPTEAALHAGLARVEALEAIDRVHLCGPRMRALHAALPVAKRGEWFEDSAAMAAAVTALVDAGDVCMVKGSLGMAMLRVVEALRALGTAEEATTVEEA